MRAAVCLLAVALCGCPLIPAAVMTPDGGPRATPALTGPRVAYFVSPERVDSALVDLDVRWGGVDRLSVTLASGERRDLRPDTQGVRIQDGLLVARSRGAREDVPLTGVSRFVVRDRPSLLRVLGLTVGEAAAGALIGGLVGSIPGPEGGTGIRRGATIGAAVGGSLGALAATTDAGRYDVHVAGF